MNKLSQRCMSVSSTKSLHTRQFQWKRFTPWIKNHRETALVPKSSTFKITEANRTSRKEWPKKTSTTFSRLEIENGCTRRGSRRSPLACSRIFVSDAELGKRSPGSSAQRPWGERPASQRTRNTRPHKPDVVPAVYFSDRHLSLSDEDTVALWRRSRSDRRFNCSNR